MHCSGVGSINLPILSEPYVLLYTQFNSSSGMCQLTHASSLRSLVTLLAELLFTRGGECTSPEDLLELYHHHFGVPLLLKHFGVASVLNLIELPEVKEVVQLVHVQVRYSLIALATPRFRWFNTIARGPVSM